MDAGMRRTAAAMTVGLGLLAGSALPAAATGPSTFSFGAGQFDTSAAPDGWGGYFKKGNETGREKSPEFRFEYRSGYQLLSFRDWFALRPYVGLAATGDGATYPNAGLLFDVNYRGFVFTPSLGAGIYSQGSGKDLGYPVEFRTSFEIGYQFSNQIRTTVGYSHMSNADLDKKNPGANSWMVYVHLPVRYLTGN